MSRIENINLEGCVNKKHEELSKRIQTNHVYLSPGFTILKTTKNMLSSHKTHPSSINKEEITHVTQNKRYQL